MLKVVCANCKKELGQKHCAPENDGQVSHGTCLDCAIELYGHIWPKEKIIKMLGGTK